MGWYGIPTGNATKWPFHHHPLPRSTCVCICVCVSVCVLLSALQLSVAGVALNSVYTNTFFFLFSFLHSLFYCCRFCHIFSHTHIHWYHITILRILHSIHHRSMKFNIRKYNLKRPECYHYHSAQHSTKVCRNSNNTHSRSVQLGSGKYTQINTWQSRGIIRSTHAERRLFIAIVLEAVRDCCAWSLGLNRRKIISDRGQC